MPTGNWYHPDVNEIIEKHSRNDAGGGGGQWCAALQPLALPCFVAFLMLGILRSKGFLAPQWVSLQRAQAREGFCGHRGGSWLPA